MVKRILKFIVFIISIFICLNFTVAFASTVTPSIAELNKQIINLQEKNQSLEKEKIEKDMHIEFYKEQNQNIAQTTSNAIANVTNMIYVVAAFITVLTILGTIVIPDRIYKKEKDRFKEIDENVKLVKTEFASKSDTIEKDFKSKTDAQKKILKNQMESIELIEEKVSNFLNQAKNSADKAKKSEETSKIYVLLNESFNLKKENKIQEAINKLNEALSYSTKNELSGKIYYKRADLHDILNEYELALKDYTKAIELNSEFADAYNDRGFVYTQLKEYELALKDYTKTIELNPQDSIAYSNCANIHKLQGEYDLALQEVAVSINLDDKNQYAFATKAEIFLCKNNMEEFYKNIELAFKYGFQVESIYEDDCYKSNLDDPKFIEIIKSYKKLA